MNKTQQIDEVSGSYRYYGEAPCGTKKSATGWTISREYVNGTARELQFADQSTKDDKVWDDRSTYNYDIDA